MDASKFAADLANVFAEEKAPAPDAREIEFRKFWDTPMYSTRGRPTGPYVFQARTNGAGGADLREIGQQDITLTAGKALDKYNETHRENPMSEKQFFHFLYGLAAQTEKPWKGKMLKLFKCGEYK